MLLLMSFIAFLFQSTPSVGRATVLAPSGVAAADNFNPRPPWGGRLSLCWWISSTEQFQSTPSVGRATEHRQCLGDKLMISIHALRGEGDGFETTMRDVAKNFNPRPPWGGRP